MAKQLVEAVKFSPDFLVIIADPKVGKTPTCMGLKDALLVDMQEGALSYRGYKKQAKTLADIKAICAENRKDRDYKVIVIDTIKEYIDALIPAAEERYKKTQAGKNFKSGVEDLLQVPYGAGTTFLEKEFDHIMETEIKTAFDKVIFLGHTKTTGSSEDNTELTVKSIDTVGKIRNVVTRQCDAIAIMTRKKNKGYLDFKNDEGAIAGSRFDYLVNQKIMISEKEGNTLNTYWENVFPDMYGKTVEEIMASQVKEEPSTPAKSSKKSADLDDDL